MIRRCLGPLFWQLVFLFNFVAALPAAQSSAPQTYSVTEVSRMTDISLFSGREANVKVYRNGFKEHIDVTIAPEGDYKGVHMRYLFDLQAHKAYMTHVDNNSCSWMRYVSPDPPANYDPIAASAAGFGKQNPEIIGTETVNGIPARIAELSAQGQGKFRFWIAEKGNFIVKTDMVGPDGKIITLMEIKQLNYSEPPDSLFALPPNCDVQTQGEWSSTGWNSHAEASVEIHGSGSVDLATDQVRGEVNVQTSGTVGSHSSSKSEMTVNRVPGTPSVEKHRVTAVQMVAVRPRPDYKGPYPGQFDFVFSITADGPAEVKYVLLNQADRVWQSGTLNFTASETKEIVLPIKVGVAGKLFEGWAKLQVYSPNRMESERAVFSVDCRP